MTADSLAEPVAPLPCNLGIVAADRDYVLRQLYEDVIGPYVWFEWPPRCCGDRLFRVEMPADQEPVGLVARVDAVIHRAIEVDDVLGDVGAELREVEIRIAAHQRIEGPLDRHHAAGHAPVALVLL